MCQKHKHRNEEYRRRELRLRARKDAFLREMKADRSSELALGVALRVRLLHTLALHLDLGTI